MADESRRGYLALLGVIIIGGLARFADEVARIIDELGYLLVGADDVGRAIRDREQNDSLGTSNDSLSGIDSRETDNDTLSDLELGSTATLDCTDAYIENFEWSSTFEGKDIITADVVNQSDIAGSVVVVVEFYPDEDKTRTLQKNYKTVALSAQGVKSIQFNVEPPEEANYALMSVDEQDCITGE